MTISQDWFEHGLRCAGDKAEYTRVNVLAITARVGSTALVSALQNSGASDGEITEIFNPRHHLKRLTEKYGVDSLQRYLNRYALDCGEGRLVLKTNWIDARPVFDEIGDDFDNFFPNARFVLMDRRDRVAQAYSLWKANEFNVWHLQKGTDYASPVQEEVPLEPIMRQMTNLQREFELWLSYFDKRGITPELVYFEDFAETPELVTQRVFEVFEGRKPVVDADSFLKRSSDSTDAAHIIDLHERLAHAGIATEAGRPS